MTYNRWLCHHGVKGMKWGVRKSIRKLNSFSRHASRIDYKVNKAEKIKSNMLLEKSITLKNLRTFLVRLNKIKESPCQ